MGSDIRQSLHGVVDSSIILRQLVRRNDIRHPLRVIAREIKIGEDQQMAPLLSLLSRHRKIMALMLTLLLEDAEANLGRILRDGNPTSPTSCHHGPLRQSKQGRVIQWLTVQTSTTGKVTVSHRPQMMCNDNGCLSNNLCNRRGAWDLVRTRTGRLQRRDGTRI